LGRWLHFSEELALSIIDDSLDDAPQEIAARHRKRFRLRAARPAVCDCRRPWCELQGALSTLP
jgi:hypothetical protein